MTSTDVAVAELRDQAVAYLGSDRRLAFLAELVHEVSLAARRAYPPHESEEYRMAAGFICHNEQFQVLASQLRTDLGGWGRGYPSPALVEALIGKARLWGCEAGVRDALARALAAASEI